MRSRVALLVPEGRIRAEPIAKPPRLDEMKGKIVGFLQNVKSNGDILLSRLADLMQKKYSLSQVRTRAKPRVTEPADFIEALASECQGVVNAHRGLRVVHVVEYPRCD